MQHRVSSGRDATDQLQVPDCEEDTELQLYRGVDVATPSDQSTKNVLDSTM